MDRTVSIHLPRISMTTLALSSLMPKFIALMEREGTTIQLPLPEPDLVAFEQRWNVKIPPDMRVFYAAMNGTGDGQETVTDYLFRIWPLEEVRPMPHMEPELPPAYGTIDDPAHYLCFSDYLLDSEVYAIHDKSSQVITVCSGHRQVASSFTDFLEKLVKDYELLF